MNIENICVPTFLSTATAACQPPVKLPKFAVTQICADKFDKISCISHLKPSNFFLFFSFLYQITKLGDNDDEQEFSSAIPLAEGETFFYGPRELKNLVMVDQMDSLAPIMSCRKITNIQSLYFVYVNMNT